MNSTLVQGAVLDASALMAALRSEPGADRVRAVLPSCSISSVNLSEVAAKAVERGLQLDTVITAIGRMQLRIIPFDEEQAFLAASLRPATSSRGLSFADRACLALGLQLCQGVMTADRAWAGLDLPIPIELIR